MSSGLDQGLARGDDSITAAPCGAGRGLSALGTYEFFLSLQQCRVAGTVITPLYRRGTRAQGGSRTCLNAPPAGGALGLGPGMLAPGGTVSHLAPPPSPAVCDTLTACVRKYLLVK